MTSKLKKWLIRSTVTIILLILVGYCSRKFVQRQLDIYATGLAEVREKEFGYDLPKVDQIEVIALTDFRSEQLSNPEVVLGYNVYKRTTLNGEHVEKVAKLWKSLERVEDRAMCHTPAYVLRFHKDGKLLFDTSVCWECENYSLSLGVFGRKRYGFKAEKSGAQTLLELLQTYVSLPPKKPNA